MNFDIREEKYPTPKYVVYVWDDDEMQDLGQMPQFSVYTEEVYQEMNDWCKETMGKHTRTAYNIFEFKKYKHLQWFMLRWTGENHGN